MRRTSCLAVCFLVATGSLSHAAAPGLYYPATSYVGTPASLHWETEPDLFRIGADGEVMRNCGGQWYPHPTDTAQYALSAWDRYVLTGDPAYLQKALRAGDYWVSHATHVGSFDVLEFPFDLQYHAWLVPAPWRNAMAQGQMLSLFARLHATTGDTKWLEAGDRLLGAFAVDLEQGGLRQVLPDGNVWYPEVAKPGFRFQILNGFLFSLVGLYDWWALTGDDRAREDARAGLLSVQAYLPQYSVPGGSRYDLVGTIASPGYHVVHLGLLRFLSGITHDGTIGSVYASWCATAGVPALPRGDADADGKLTWKDTWAVRQAIPRREFEGAADVTHNRAVDQADLFSVLDALHDDGVWAQHDPRRESRPRRD